MADLTATATACASGNAALLADIPNSDISF